MTSEPEWVFRATGQCAHWAGINFGPERMTQRAPSRSAVVGLLRSVFGKYEYRWEPSRVIFLRVPSMMPIMTNDMQSFDGGSPLVSTQRIRTFLYGIDIVIHAKITRATCAGPEDNLLKAHNMIESRARRGHRSYTPSFGPRECMAHLEWIENGQLLPGLAPARINENLGNVFYDFDIDDPERPAYLAPLEIKNGVVEYPSFDEVRKFGIRYNLPRVWPAEAMRVSP